MPDISMCKGVNNDNVICPKREDCYRYKATPSEHWQSYFTVAPFDNKKYPKICEYFWKIESKSQYKRLEVIIK